MKVKKKKKKNFDSAKNMDDDDEKWCYEKNRMKCRKKTTLNNEWLEEKKEKNSKT